MLSITFIKEEYSKEIKDVPSLEESCQAILNESDYIESHLRNIWHAILLVEREQTSATKLFFKMNKANKSRLDLPWEELLINLPTSDDKLLYLKELLSRLDLHVCDLDTLEMGPSDLSDLSDLDTYISEETHEKALEEASKPYPWDEIQVDASFRTKARMYDLVKNANKRLAPKQFKVKSRKGVSTVTRVS
jgi:hypothetical protein